MLRTLPLLILCLACRTPTEIQSCESIQWIILARVPECCTPDNPYGPDFAGVVIIGPEHTSTGAAFPYSTSQYLGISTVEFSSKLVPLGDWARGSYFHLSLSPLVPAPDLRLLISVPSIAPFMTFTPPIRVPPGSTVYADFLNNAPWPQWMSATITGYLSDDPAFEACR